MKIEEYQEDELPKKKIETPKILKLPKPEFIETNNDVDYPENKPPVAGRLGPTEEELAERRKKIDKMRRELIKDEAIIYTKSGEYKKASQLTIPEQEDEIIKCKTDPIYFICTYLTIFDQTQGEGGLIVPFKLFPYQADLIHDYINHRFVIPNKYRQAGISTATCAYIAWYVSFNKNRSVAIVANKQTMAENELMKDVVDFVTGCPAWLVPKTGKIERLDKNGKKIGKDLKDTQSLKIYDNGSTLAAFSSKGLRGYTPTLLYWDEVAWTEKNDVFWTATKPALQTGGAAILVSTPQGLDSVYFKTFEGARKKENNFHAVELWWFNDPRYNNELAWFKNKGQENEIKINDDNYSYEKRSQLKEDGWEASSPWLEEQIKDANGDIRKIKQELLCVNYDSILTIYNLYSKEIENITIKDFYNRLNIENTAYNSVITNSDIINSSFLMNYNYLILNNTTFVDFLGIEKTDKKTGLKITLENDSYITVSKDHIFIVGSKNIYANSLVPNISYLTTAIGDLFVKSIEAVEDCEFYDIIDSQDCEYYANNILNHNCSFLGSGDNFIAEEYLKRIEENDILVPLRQEYIDLNMWIFEDPIKGEEYVIGIDASPGHGDDNSTMNILKKREIVEEKIIIKNGKEKKQKIRRFEVEQVAEYYGKLPPDQLAEMAYQYGKAYNDAYIVVDVTGGYGVQSVTKLIEYGYTNFHYAEVSHKPTRDMLSGYIKKGQRKSNGSNEMVDLVPGFFIGNNRASVLLELQRSIHLKMVIIRSSRLLSELKTFVTIPGNRVADHKRSFHDDSIMGLSIGLYVINYDMVKGNRGKSFDEKMLNAMLSSNDVERMNKERGIVKPKYDRYNANNPMNPYIANAWLFQGLKK